MRRIVSLVILFVTLLVSLPLGNLANADPSEQPMPTVFLHGWRGNSLTFAPFFKQAKLTRPQQQVIKMKVYVSGKVKVTRPKVVQEDVYIEVILAGTSVQTIGLKRQLNLFKRAMKEVQTLTGSERVNIVSHSMGGVVATKYILQQAKQGNQQGLPTVNRLVTLDAPIHGTHLGNVYEKFGKMLVVNAINPINLVVQGYNGALRIFMPEG